MRLFLLLFIVRLAIGQLNTTRESKQQFLPNAPLCQQCSCGGGAGIRIVGGGPVPAASHPWLVALRERVSRSVFCGASLIASRHALTAAHCVQGMPVQRLEALLLDTRRRIIRAVIHPQFNSPVKYNNDIAVIKFDVPVLIPSTMVPVCLPQPGADVEGKMAIIVGWGRTDENGSVTQSLRQGIVPILSTDLCTSLPGMRGVTSNMLCAGHLMGGADACQGDSGGPLLVAGTDRIVIAGIVSWGIGCGRPNRPGVYTKVDNYIPWIASHTTDSCFCF